MSIDVESMGFDYVLDSKYEIENVLILIQEVESKTKFFKELKQYRTKQIDEEIKELGERADRLRQVVLRTMISTDAKKKTMHFPGVGKVTRRAGKRTWKIKDEKAVLVFLEEQGVKNQVTETKEVIVKKEVNKIFECLHDQKIDIPGVESKDAAEGISISYEDETESTHPSKVKPKESSPEPTSVDNISEQDL
jgi:ribosome biogenesis protein Nip4